MTIQAPGELRPCPWRLQDPPPGPCAVPGDGDRSEPPLLLLIDRREPLAPELRQHLSASLSREERHRHDACRRPEDRERFLLGRAGLRRLLGPWLGLPPQAVPVATGPHGKPHCPGGPAFNVSHSGDLILLALHACRTVGVDVERVRPGLDWPAIARRVLPPAELETIASLSAGERPEAFLAAWCRLEARLKARGEGLAGLERLRREPTSPARAAGLCGAVAPSHEPLWQPPPPQLGGAGPTTTAAETVWNVAVPGGYRAAAALAAAHR